jgi:type IV pilus assembly protein PilV
MPVIPHQYRTSGQAGFTLLEVMIALVIFSIGLLGLGALQAVGVQENLSAYNRTLAMQQAADMGERIRANYTAANGGSYDSISTTLTSVPSACIGSSATNCTDTQMAANDIYAWNKKTQELLPSGRGKVSRSGDLFVITVMWDEDRTGATGENCSGNPANDLKCYTLRFQL